MYSEFVEPSFSGGNNNCVAVWFYYDEEVFVKNSSEHEGPILRVPTPHWLAFIAAIRAGMFDVAELTSNWSSPAYAPEGIQVASDQRIRMRYLAAQHSKADRVASFSPLEWIVFIEAVRRGEYTLPKLPLS